MDPTLSATTFAILGMLSTVLGSVVSLFLYTKSKKKKDESSEILLLELIKEQKLEKDLTELILRLNSESIETSRLERLVKIQKKQNEILEQLKQSSEVFPE